VVTASSKHKNDVRIVRIRELMIARLAPEPQSCRQAEAQHE